MDRQRVERRRGHLSPDLIDAGGGAGKVVPLVGVPRRVVASTALEGRQQLARSRAVASHLNCEDRIERPHHGKEVARAERLVDKPGERAAHPGRIRRAHVVLVEEDREQPRVGPRRVRPLVGVGWLRPRVILGGKALVDPDEPRFVYRLRLAVLGDLEVAGLEGIDGAAAGVGGDDVDAVRPQRAAPSPC